MADFFKKMIMYLMTDKDFLNMISSILEVFVKDTSNKIDDQLIDLLKNEADKMPGSSLKSYKDRED